VHSAGVRGVKPRGTVDDIFGGSWSRRSSVKHVRNTRSGCQSAFNTFRRHPAVFCLAGVQYAFCY
jgi:hypothetical protein